MPPWQRRFVIICAGVIGFCLAYATCDYAELPRLAYLPMDHSWTVVSGSAGPAASGYLGTVLWGVAGAALATGLTAAATHLVRRELSARAIDLARAWAVAAFLFAGSYFTWKEWPF